MEGCSRSTLTPNGPIGLPKHELGSSRAHIGRQMTRVRWGEGVTTVESVIRATAVVSAVLLALTGCSSSESADGGHRDDTTSSTTTKAPRPDASSVTELLAVDHPIVLAHAGGDDIHPHDTPFGFDRSAEAGVDALDMDVQMSADGVLVVQHDDTVDRTTNGTGEVASMTYDELNALDAAYWFTKDCTCKDRPNEDYIYRGVRTGDRPAPKGSQPDDFAITGFEKIAKSHPGWVLNVEIKGEAPDALPAAAELARLTKELDLTDRMVVTSFDDDVAEAYAAAAPGVSITPGLSATTAYVLSKQLPPSGRTILQVPPEYEGLEVVTEELVERAHADGLVLWVWPNDAEWENADGYAKLLDLGVDGLNAADPVTALEVVRSRS